jgi:hypothetical protein
MTLSCSRHSYEEPLWTQEREGFRRIHEHAFLHLWRRFAPKRPNVLPSLPCAGCVADRRRCISLVKHGEACALSQSRPAGGKRAEYQGAVVRLRHLKTADVRLPEVLFQVLNFAAR